MLSAASSNSESLLPNPYTHPTPPHLVLFLSLSLASYCHFTVAAGREKGLLAGPATQAGQKRVHVGRQRLGGKPRSVHSAVAGHTLLPTRATHQRDLLVLSVLLLLLARLEMAVVVA